MNGCIHYPDDIVSLDSMLYIALEYNGNNFRKANFEFSEVPLFYRLFEITVLVKGCQDVHSSDEDFHHG